MIEPGEIFSNSQINLQQLPDAEHLEMVSLEPAYKNLRYVSGIIISLIILIVTWTFILLQTQLWPYSFYVGGFISLLAIWIIFYQGLSFHYMGYALREKDISFKSGLLWRSMTTVPFNRVQHCDLKQGILDRRFGLSKLTIYTAGGQSTDLMIPGLLPETAERLKTFILQSTEQSAE
jgi:uncharacterized protein